MSDQISRSYPDSCPQSATVTVLEVLPLEDPTSSIARTTSIPSTTCSNTTCFPSSHYVLAVQTQNCDPFVPGPAFAIYITLHVSPPPEPPLHVLT
ncbi:hypothetical protein MRB53_004420 [Persea americana]|uniref:Uncharacterized protein n=1 Tax=Persea americana TaxID=3435 RepID=A0ACC2MA62_PERAE|nr:hypothetical protein MRB53_004420 [Persea americana]